MSSRKFSVRIITYNVLSQTLCRPSHFHKNDPLDLVPETRFQRLLEKLKPEVEKQSVLTLQEVSQKWAGKLHTFFARNNYHFVVRLYGSAFSDYMGVGIAIPLENFTILQTDIQRLSSTITWPRRPEPTGLVSVFRSVYSYFQGVVNPVVLLANRIKGSSLQYILCVLMGAFNNNIFMNILQEPKFGEMKIRTSMITVRKDIMPVYR
mmetsp:Transcript_31105/g.38415  ORF Transcript_31105/g.38415 Transcript_31105/m.38415 type:complete len:207 (+) Transcript_31105:113-733(+)